MYITRRLVEFAIFEEDTIKATKALSIFGTVRIDPIKNKPMFRMSVIVEPGNLTRCLDRILKLSSDRVDIQNLNITYTL